MFYYVCIVPPITCAAWIHFSLFITGPFILNDILLHKENTFYIYFQMCLGDLIHLI